MNVRLFLRATPEHRDRIDLYSTERPLIVREGTLAIVPVGSGMTFKGKPVAWDLVTVPLREVAEIALDDDPGGGF